MSAQSAFLIFALVVLIAVALAAGRRVRSGRDRDMSAQIVSALNREFSLAAAHIDVKVFSGTVILGGVVREFDHSRRAEAIARSVAGVSGVDNRITVRSGG